MIAILFALSLFGAVAAQAQPLPNAAPPNSVNKVTADAFAACRQAGGRPEVKAGYQTNYEINHDGKPDVLLDMSRLACVETTSAAPACGSVGCPLRNFLSGPKGLQPALDVPVLRWSVALQGPRTVLTLSLPGSQCEPTSAAACERRLVWIGPGFAAQKTGHAFPAKH